MSTRLALVLLLLCLPSCRRRVVGTVDRTQQECGPTPASDVDGLPSPALGVDLTEVGAKDREVWLDGVKELALPWVRLSLDLEQSPEALEEFVAPFLLRHVNILFVVVATGPQQNPFEATNASHWRHSLERLAAIAHQLEGRVRHFEISVPSGGELLESIKRLPDGKRRSSEYQVGAARLFAAFFEEARKTLKRAAPRSLAIAAPEPRDLEEILRDPEHPGARAMDGVRLTSFYGGNGLSEETLTGHVLDVLCETRVATPLWFVPSKRSGGPDSQESEISGFDDGLAVAMVSGRGFWKPGGNEQGVLSFAAVGRILAGARYDGSQALSRERPTFRLTFMRDGAFIDVYRVDEGRVQPRRPAAIWLDARGKPIAPSAEGIAAPGGFLLERDPGSTAKPAR